MGPLIIIIFICSVQVSNCQDTDSSPLTNLLELLQVFPQGSPTGGTLGSTDSLVRTQQEVLTAYAFPCARTRGGNYFTKPELVRNVGPADIDVVAAIGDHLVTGTGALANTTIDTFKDFPQVSFAIGGKGNWRRFTTIPNILKEFNPYMIGYSIGPYRDKGFNFGSSDAASSDLAEQARELIRVLETDTRVDMNRDWKLVTVSSGVRDLCHLSCKSGHTQQNFVDNMKQALDILFTLPNIIIQVISPMGNN